MDALLARADRSRSQKKRSYLLLTMGTLEDTSRAKITVGMDMVEMTIITLVEESN